MNKRSNDTQVKTSTQTVTTTSEQARIMREGGEAPDTLQVGPGPGMNAETLAKLEQIQREVLARYGVEETKRSRITGRLRDLDPGED